MEFSPDESKRYSRHFLLPEVGERGQQKLREATVLLVGLGGLGCPAALYLAAAGVGRLVLMDGDVVSLANLQRQVLFSTSDVGRPKVEAARDRLLALNPHLMIDVRRDRLSASNALAAFEAADIVVDGSDNFPTRYLTSDAAVRTGRPVVFGAIERFRGQVALIHPAAGGPCYRCLFPQIPPPGAIPTCEEAGVLGVLPGIIGSMQAAEAIKYLVGFGRSLAGRLLVMDVAEGTSRTVAFRRVPDCPGCGRAEELGPLREEVFQCATGLTDGASGAVAGGAVEELGYEEFFGRWKQDEEGAKVGGWDGPLLIDVRTEAEVALGQVPGARVFPLQELEGRLGEIGDLAKEMPVYVYCQRGARSLKAAYRIQQALGLRAYSLRGGYETYLDSGGEVGLGSAGAAERRRL